MAELTAKFDGHSLPWRIDMAQCHAALDALDSELRTALELAAVRIRTFHEGQRPADRDMTDAAGVRLGARWNAVDAAGLYVPGGYMMSNCTCLKGGATLFLTTFTRVSEPTTSSRSLIWPVRRMSRRTLA